MSDRVLDILSALDAYVTARCDERILVHLSGPHPWDSEIKEARGRAAEAAVEFLAALRASGERL